VKAVLREIRLAAARRDTNPEPALFIVENEHVALARRAFQTVDAVYRELHGRPCRSGPTADPLKLRFATGSVASCQEGMA